MANMPSFQRREETRRFLISGVHRGPELASLHSSIVLLGATVEDIQHNNFVAVCTHVIAREFTPTVKVLAALAGGKWLLHPDYVTESARQGHWLRETDYELSNYDEVAKYFRRLRERTGRLIYAGWTMYISLENKKMTKFFEKVVAAGGAKVASLSEISKVNLVISDAVMVSSARVLVGCFTPVVSTSYVKDTLILKADPLDLRRHVLDCSGNTFISRKYYVGDTNNSQEVVDVNKNRCKRPIADLGTARKKFCAQSENICTRVKQPSVDSKGVNAGPPLIRESDSPVYLKLTKYNLKKGMASVIKTECLNDIPVYCANVSQCVMRESQDVATLDDTECLDSDQMIYPSNHINSSSEIRELTSYETSYYEACTDQNTNEKEFIVQGLEALYLNITPYTYLPTELFADLLKKFVFETQYGIVHSRALGLSYYILAFHPPVNSRMRSYYLEVLDSTFQNSEQEFNRAWTFVHSAIEALQTHLTLEEEVDYSQSCYVDGTTTIVNHSLGLLQFLLALFKKDMKENNNSECVGELLTWQVFWGHSRNPSATVPVKELIQLWVSMSSAPPSVKHCLSQLVSMVLELTWRSEKQSLLPYGPLPNSLFHVGNELQLRIKDCGSCDSMKLILDLSSPWAKMVVCSVIFQRIAPVQNAAITLEDIMECYRAMVARAATTSCFKTTSAVSVPG
ncbi:hypothetical protein OTU49_005770 [Cherax quadricarinatus]|uniref:BRCT domain-containing protein n=1 Tax=Cherax quadricarinatus TaxID=27406 RepID=A0AAW0X4Z4_CHEQU